MEYMKLFNLRMKKDVKASDGRRKMSKRLMEEAMNYFDEGRSDFRGKSSSASTTYCSDDHVDHNKDSNNQAQLALKSLV